MMNLTSTVMPPHAFARIVRDKQTLNIIYQITEPPLTKKEQEQRDEIMDIFIRSLTANIEEIDSNPEAYVRTAMDKVIKSYSMKINKKIQVQTLLLFAKRPHWLRKNGRG